MLPNQTQLNDAEDFSQQLVELNKALHQAGQLDQIYNETGPPNCWPTKSETN